FRNILELRRRVIDRHIRAKLFEQILVWRRGRRDHFRAACFCNLDSETADPTRSAVNEDGLSRAKLRRVDQRLPRGQGCEWHTRSFYKRDRLRLCCRFSLRCDRTFRVTASPHDIRVYWISNL